MATDSKVKNQDFKKVQTVYKGKPFITNNSFMESQAQSIFQREHSQGKTPIEKFGDKFQYTTKYSLDYRKAVKPRN